MTHRYYHSLLEKQYRYFIPVGKKVLEIGRSNGDLLSAVRPAVGVKAANIEELKSDVTFDYIILSGLLGDIDDIETFLVSLRRFCGPDTRVIIEHYSYLWQSLLKVAENLGLKKPTSEQNWLTYSDVANFLALAGYDAIKKERCTLLPFNIWGISFVVNKFLAKLPIFNALTLNHFVVARPLFVPAREYSVTILVPCRNEKGNIEQAITRTPAFGRSQEFIFVEGHSKDGTYEEMERVKRAYPHKDIRLFKQPGKGKGDAVRFGFAEAKGEVLMILDADLTVPPEDMPKFYNAIQSGKGEFINGCRLVYPMEDEAMRFLNLLANKFFGLFFSWLLGQRFKDTLCGTKVIFKHHYEELVANRHYFGDFDPFGDFDLIFGAVKLNLKAIELPIRYKSRQYGTTQIQRFRHGLLLLRMCAFAMKKIKFI